MMSQVPPATVAAIQRAMADRQDFTGRLGQIQTPTLVVSGQHDPISPPADNQQWGKHIANSRIAIIPAAAHLPQVEAADELCHVMIEFCNSI
jgi:pimeloyl-ACP methyl ester carboxylesterase